jgi:hypothetical protein
MLRTAAATPARSACLPALIGVARADGGALLSSSGTFPVDSAALERPDWTAAHRVIMSAIGDAYPGNSPIRAIDVTTRIRWPSPTRRASSRILAARPLLCRPRDIQDGHR